MSVIDDVYCIDDYIWVIRLGIKKPQQLLYLMLKYSGGSRPILQWQGALLTQAKKKKKRWYESFKNFLVQCLSNIKCYLH